MDEELESVAVTVKQETANAYLLADTDYDAREEWFPKSQVSFETRNMSTGKAVAEIPLWLLAKKGWN